jgi:hypothetical protein
VIDIEHLPHCGVSDWTSEGGGIDEISPAISTPVVSIVESIAVASVAVPIHQRPAIALPILEEPDQRPDGEIEVILLDVPKEIIKPGDLGGWNDPSALNAKFANLFSSISIQMVKTAGQ